MYQHMHDVHKQKYSKREKAQNKEMIMNTVKSSGLLPLAEESIVTFYEWLQSLDGERKSPKTAQMYRSCIEKTVASVCEGSLENLSHYNIWIEKGNYFDQMINQLAPTTVQTYLSSLKKFVSFLTSKGGERFRKAANLPISVMGGARDAFDRWFKSMQKEKKKSIVQNLSKAQTSIPDLSQRMQSYYSSEQYR